eukprot:SAG31_NODE_14232_length_819_cov_1.248611_1_plen_165_part_01
MYLLAGYKICNSRVADRRARRPCRLRSSAMLMHLRAGIGLLAALAVAVTRSTGASSPSIWPRPLKVQNGSQTFIVVPSSGFFKVPQLQQSGAASWPALSPSTKSTLASALARYMQLTFPHMRSSGDGGGGGTSYGSLMYDDVVAFEAAGKKLLSRFCAHYQRNTG